MNLGGDWQWKEELLAAVEGVGRRAAVYRAVLELRLIIKRTHTFFCNFSSNCFIIPCAIRI